MIYNHQNGKGGNMNNNEEQVSSQRRKGKRRQKRHGEERQQDEGLFQREKEVIPMELGGYPTEILTPNTTTSSSTTTPTTTPIRQQHALDHDTIMYKDSVHSDHPQRDCHEESQIHHLQEDYMDLLNNNYHGREEEVIPIPFDHSAEHHIYLNEEKLQQRNIERLRTIKTVAIILIVLLIAAIATTVCILHLKSKTIESTNSKDGESITSCTLDRELLIQCPTGYLEVPTCAKQTFQQLQKEFIPQSVQNSSHLYPCNAQYYSLVATAIAKIHMTDSSHETLDEHEIREMILQYWILGIFYFALGGEDWQLNYNWLSGISPCDENWYGLSCARRNNHTTSIVVVTIEMSANQLLGSFPTEIMGLTSLQVLQLAGNDIMGTIPTEIGRMRNLMELNFADTNLAGTIPTEIGLCSKLQSFNLLGTTLMGSIPTEMGHLSVLGYLGLSSDFLEGTIPTEMGLLAQLTKLHLTNLLSLQGGIPSQFVNLSSLSEILLIDTFDDRNQFSYFLSCLPKKSLVSLEIINSGLEGTIPSNISSFQSLTVLSLKSVTFTGSIPTELGLMTNLEVLELEGLALSFTSSIPSDIGQLTKLQLLNLACNELEDNSLPAEITQLSDLYIIPLNSW